MSTQEQDFQWTDKLVIEFAVNWMKERVAFAITNDLAAAPLPIQVSVERFKNENGEKRSPEYEVLTLRSASGALASYDKCEAGCYNYPMSKTYRNREDWVFYFLNSFAKWTIHSVRRLSDGEVFSVGDTVYHVDGLYPVTITEFYQPPSERGEMWFYWSGFKETVKNLDNFKKQDSQISPPKPLFTTEDGVDIYEGGEIWQVSVVSNYAIHKTVARPELFPAPSYFKYFSKQYNAELYALENKVCLSAKEVFALTAKYGLEMVQLEHDITQLVKAKL